MMQHIEAMFEAKNELAEALGQAVPGLDLIEVFANAKVSEGLDDMSVDEVRELVLTVARQRIEGAA